MTGSTFKSQASKTKPEQYLKWSIFLILMGMSMMPGTALAEVFDLRKAGEGPFRVAVLGTNTAGTEQNRPCLLIGAGSDNPRSDLFELMLDIGSPASGTLEFKRKNRISVDSYSWAIRGNLIREILKNCSHLLITSPDLERVSGIASSLALESATTASSFTPSVVVTTKGQLAALKPLFQASGSSLGESDSQSASPSGSAWKTLLAQDGRALSISASWTATPLETSGKALGWILKSSPRRGWILATGPEDPAMMLGRALKDKSLSREEMASSPGLIIADVRYPGSMNALATQRKALTPDLLILALARALLDHTPDSNWTPGRTTRQYLVTLAGQLTPLLRRCTIVIFGRGARDAEIIAREAALYSRVGLNIITPEQGDLILK